MMSIDEWLMSDENKESLYLAILTALIYKNFKNGTTLTGEDISFAANKLGVVWHTDVDEQTVSMITTYLDSVEERIH